MTNKQFFFKVVVPVLIPALVTSVYVLVVKEHMPEIMQFLKTYLKAFENDNTGFNNFIWIYLVASISSATTVYFIKHKK